MKKENHAGKTIARNVEKNDARRKLSSPVIFTKVRRN